MKGGRGGRDKERREGGDRHIEEERDRREGEG